jgi:hypothetical protein
VPDIPVTPEENETPIDEGLSEKQSIKEAETPVLDLF